MITSVGWYDINQVLLDNVLTIIRMQLPLDKRILIYFYKYRITMRSLIIYYYMACFPNILDYIIIIIYIKENTFKIWRA